MRITGESVCSQAQAPTIGGLERGTAFCRPGKKATYVKADSTDQDVQDYLRAKGHSTRTHSAAFTVAKGRLNAYSNSEKAVPLLAEVSVRRA